MSYLANGEFSKTDKISKYLQAHVKKIEHFNDVNCTTDWNAYLQRYPDLTAAFGSDINAAKNHYKQYGNNEGRNMCSLTPNCSVDWSGYLKRYPDLTNAFGSDVNQSQNHFKQYGTDEGRNPCTLQPDWNCYLKRYPDLTAAFGTDINQAQNHWNTYGKNEGRNPYGPC